MTTKFSFIVLAFLASFATIQGQTSGPKLWSQQFQRPASSPAGSPPLETFNDVKSLSSGNVIAVGYTTGATPIDESDLLIRKISSSTGAIMNEIFIDYYGGVKNDAAIRVLVAEPYIYVIGTSTFSLAPNDKDIVIMKMDTSLTTIWSRSFNNTGNPNDVAVDAGLDLFGNLYVLGNTTRTTTGGDIILRKYDSNGNVLFTKFYTSSGNFNDEARAMVVEPNGICDITGFYTSSTLGSRLLALKVWSNGAQLWVKYHDATTGVVLPDEGVSVSYDPVNNDMYVCGRGQNSSGNYDWVVVRFAGSDGTKVWYKKYVGVGNLDDAGIKVIYDSGSLYSCGNINTTVSGVTSKNIQLRKLNPADGATVWNKTYNFLNGANGPSEDVVTSMLVSPSGIIYLCGYIYYPTPTSVAPYQLVMAYNSSGVQQWAHMESSSSGSAFQGIDVRALAYSPSQNALYAVGYKWATISLISYSTIMKFGPVSIVSPIAEKVGDDASSIIAPKLYPNPASDFIQLQRFDEGVGQIQVLDATGKLVLQAEVQEETTRMDVNSLLAGMYIVRYTCNGQTQYMRFIRE